MKTKHDIIQDIDLIVGRNSEVTDDAHMDLVDEISDYIEAIQAKGGSGEVVYCALFNDNTWESCAGTLSIHSTRKGAEMAIDFHRKEWLIENDEDNPPDSVWWGVREMKIDSTPPVTPKEEVDWDDILGENVVLNPPTPQDDGTSHGAYPMSVGQMEDTTPSEVGEYKDGTIVKYDGLPYKILCKSQGFDEQYYSLEPVHNSPIIRSAVRQVFEKDWDQLTPTKPVIREEEIIDIATIIATSIAKGGRGLWKDYYRAAKSGAKAILTKLNQ